MKQDLTTQSVAQLLKLMAINCLEKIEIVMGGGVAIYVKNTVNAILRTDLTFIARNIGQDGGHACALEAY